MLDKLQREDLYTLEQYAEMRSEFRQRMKTHKRDRIVHIGPNATLHFEDRLTMQYQIQEVLRTEKIFEPLGIQEELDVYNPLIPDGSNWKATLMIEYEDVEERQRQLAKMVGIEDKIWVRVDGLDRVWAIADEDLERENEQKTSSVHFLRFELTRAMVDAAHNQANISVGIDHDAYRHALDPLPSSIRDSLVADLAT